jgi:hypothetical protein
LYFHGYYTAVKKKVQNKKEAIYALTSPKAILEVRGRFEKQKHRFQQTQVHI